jgi:hypothetical protein
MFDPARQVGSVGVRRQIGSWRGWYEVAIPLARYTEHLAALYDEDE